MHDHWVIIACAFILDIVFGYPQWLDKRIRHPVVWIGAGIALLEKNFNRPEWSGQKRKIAGVVTMLILLATVGIPALLLQNYMPALIDVLLIASLMATHSLYDHVNDVYHALTHEGLETARQKVSRIVGRDVETLDEAGVCRAAIESLAESFSDGVMVPLFWAICFGLPGIALYKAVNTADSMIGHKDERYLAFGWAAAKLDDLANYIPARLSGALIVTVTRSGNAWKTMLRDAMKHASPNAGWPEAAMAGALGIQLGGTNYYDYVAHHTPTLGIGTIPITALQLHKAIGIYCKACALLTFTLLVMLIVT